MSLVMFPRETRQHRIARVVEKILSWLIGDTHSDRWARCVPYCDGYRMYLKTTGPLSTSYMFSRKKKWEGTGDFEIPAGEKITVYLSRGHVYRFWKGECWSVDSCHEELEGTKYDMEPLETHWAKRKLRMQARRASTEQPSAL